MFRLVVLAFGLLAATTVLAAPRSLYRTTGNTVNTSSGVLSYAEDWNYANVRTDAYLFWWLYAVQPAANRPLVIWFQGGPGSSGVGYGNFEENGPKTIAGTDNYWTWLQLADLLYVDNPVGTGFSYFRNNAYTHNITEIGVDMISWLRQFLVQHPEYKNRPFFIFSESYGGKYSVELARQIITASPTIGLSDFRGVALGDSWISPVDFVTSWGPFLYTNAYLDSTQRTTIEQKAQDCVRLNNTLDFASDWTPVADCCGDVEDAIEDFSGGVSFYNILKTSNQDDWSASASETLRQSMYRRHVAPQNHESLEDYMNNEVRKKVQIIPSDINFGAQSGKVFDTQYSDFMKPTIATVDALLNANVPVYVVEGSLDLICDTVGAEQWLERLSWPGYPSFNASAKTPFGTAVTPLGGFRKSYSNLHLVYVLRAGHMLAHDTPDVGLEVLRQALAGN